MLLQLYVQVFIDFHVTCQNWMNREQKKKTDVFVCRNITLVKISTTVESTVPFESKASSVLFSQ